jgi:hypothetical protein
VGFLIQWGAEFSGPLIINVHSATPIYSYVSIDKYAELRRNPLYQSRSDWGHAAIVKRLVAHNRGPDIQSRTFLTAWVNMYADALKGGAWLHDKVNSRRGMFLVGTAGCLVLPIYIRARR